MQGLARKGMEDSFAVVRRPSRPVVGVFDGVGGRPRGGAASQAAAAALSSAPGLEPEPLARHLDTAVRRTGGFSTAAVAVLGERVTFVGVGDSAAYDRAGLAILKSGRDARGALATCLGGGWGVSSASRRAAQGPFVLCTDGVDDVLGPLRPQAPLDHWAGSIMSDLQAAGAPDDATLIAFAKR